MTSLAGTKTKQIRKRSYLFNVYIYETTQSFFAMLVVGWDCQCGTKPIKFKQKSLKHTALSLLHSAWAWSRHWVFYIQHEHDHGTESSTFSISMIASISLVYRRAILSYTVHSGALSPYKTLYHFMHSLGLSSATKHRLSTARCLMQFITDGRTDGQTDSGWRKLSRTEIGSREVYSITYRRAHW
jgi:hypothetical protein